MTKTELLTRPETQYLELHEGEGKPITKRGARFNIVPGRGHPESLMNCSQGAGRAMSQGEAKRRFMLEDRKRMTEGVECRKDAEVVDETLAAYKPIEAVTVAQSDLVDVVHTLHQVVCVKG